MLFGLLLQLQFIETKQCRNSRSRYGLKPNEQTMTLEGTRIFDGIEEIVIVLDDIEGIFSHIICLVSVRCLVRPSESNQAIYNSCIL